MTKAVNFLTGLLTGILLGGGVALLFAPRSGENMRRLISERWGEVREQYQDAYDEQRELLEQRFIELKGG